MADLKSVIVINFHGINCQYCIYAMRHKLKQISTVENLDVDPQTVRLVLPSITQSDVKQIEKIIFDSGYIPDQPIMAKTD